MSRLIRRIRYIVMIVLFLLSARYALTLRQHYRTILNGFSQVHGGSAVLKRVTDPVPHLMRKEPMAAAFRSGHLPDPLPVPPGDADQVAAELAKRVLANDEHSTASLLTALRLSGFTVRADDGSVAVPSGQPGQGLVFDAWQVAAMAKLFGEGTHVSFAPFNETLARTLPRFKGVPVAKLLLEDIAADGQSNKQPLRFWARFITELGRQSDRPYDLLTGTVDPAVVHLDSIQFSLIIERLAGDLMSQNRNPKPAPHAAAWRSPDTRDSSFVEAVFRQDYAPRLVYAANPPTPADPPCTMDEAAATATDFGALAETFGFSQLAEYLHSKGVAGIGDYAEGVADFNALLIAARFVWIQSAMSVKITMDEPELVRTKSTTAGERRHLTATVAIDIGKWQALNCLRMVSGMTGIDLGNLPKNADGVGIAWRMPEGGDSRGALGVAENWIPLVVGQAVDSDAIVGFAKPEDNKDPRWSPGNQTAGVGGVAEIDVVGAPQKQDLSNMKVVPEMKEMAVQIAVKFKNANEPSKLPGEAVDLLGSLVAVLSEDPGAPVNVATEMMYRCHCLESPVFKFPVKDWMPCTGGWTGTIKYVRTLNRVQTTPQPAGFVRQAADNSEKVQFQVTGSRTAEDAKVGNFTGTFSAQVTNKSLTLRHASEINYWCGKDTTDDTQEYTTSGSGNGKASFQIVVTPTEFYIWGGADEELPVTMKETRHIENVNQHLTPGHCEGIAQPSVGPPASLKQSLVGARVSGPSDPKHPDELTGSKTEKLPDGTVLTIQWNLVHCDKEPSFE